LIIWRFDKLCLWRLPKIELCIEFCFISGSVFLVNESCVHNAAEQSVQWTKAGILLAFGESTPTAFLAFWLLSANARFCH